MRVGVEVGWGRIWLDWVRMSGYGGGGRVGRKGVVAWRGSFVCGVKGRFEVEGPGVW